MNTENPEKETIIDENTTENSVNEIESATELSFEEKLQEDLANEKDKFLRLFAEFENFKRRTAKERIDLFKTANQDVLQSMLPVLDDFDRAMLEISKSDDDVLLKGVELIHEKLKVTGKIGILKNKLIHYSYSDYESYKAKMINYGKLKAQEKFIKKLKPIFFASIFHPTYNFLYNYFIRLGILDGRKGVVICYLNAYSVYIRYQELKKLWNSK